MIVADVKKGTIWVDDNGGTGCVVWVVWGMRDKGVDDKGVLVEREFRVCIPEVDARDTIPGEQTAAEARRERMASVIILVRDSC
jgi:hypothetical protein